METIGTPQELPEPSTSAHCEARELMRCDPRIPLQVRLIYALACQIVALWIIGYGDFDHLVRRLQKLRGIAAHRYREEFRDIKPPRN